MKTTAEHEVILTMNLAVEIAHTAGLFGYFTEDRVTAFNQFIEWAGEFRRRDCPDGLSLPGQLDAFVRGKMIDEVCLGNAIFGCAAPGDIQYIMARSRRGITLVGMPCPALDQRASPLLPYDAAAMDFIGVKITHRSIGSAIEGDEPPVFIVSLLADEAAGERERLIGRFDTHEQARRYADSLLSFVISNHPLHQRDQIKLTDAGVPAACRRAGLFGGECTFIRNDEQLSEIAGQFGCANLTGAVIDEDGAVWVTESPTPFDIDAGYELTTVAMNMTDVAQTRN